MVQFLYQRLLQFWHGLFPSFCLLCRLHSSGGQLLCVDCYRSLPWLQACCVRCGNVLSHADLNLCGHCLKQPPLWQTTLAACQYQTPVITFIHRLKFQKQLIYAQLLAQLLLGKLQSYYQYHALPECIIPVPLHPQRLKERGFNQVVEIARILSKKLQIPLNRYHGLRIHATLPQAHLSQSQRQQNVTKAFKIQPGFKFKYVAIIDDVVTTGNTILAFAQALRQAGVENIAVWCCAHTQMLKNVI
ncbi:MAG: ComF family protein [Gammaproteobacteria bacterium]